MSEGPLLWYLNRASGLTAMAMFTASVVWGVLASRGAHDPARTPRFVVQHLHRHFALLGTALLVVHVTTAVVDSYVDIRWWQVVVPFGATYEPLWLGLGALAFDLMLAVLVNNALRARLGHRVWRRFHHLAWLGWGVGVVHAVGMGTDFDESRWWAWLPLAVSVGAVAVAALVRPRRAEREKVTTS